MIDEDYEWELADIAHDEFMIRGGIEIMHREIIDLDNTDLLIADMDKLVDYVWQGNKLIPIELLEGE